MTQSDDNGSDWKDLDKMFDRAGANRQVTVGKSSKALENQQVLEPAGARPVEKPDGIIAQYKHNKLHRRVALKHVEAWYEGRLDATRHAVTEAVRVKKAEATEVAERMLMLLQSEHLHYLTTLGLRNEAVLGEALTELGNQTTRLLTEVRSKKDWPPQIIESTLQNLIDRHLRFSQKIMTDLGEIDAKSR